jgi:oxygen-dependent protoporphyrinogen oxidase
VPKIVIVGAGISGLAVAYGLERLAAGAEITVLDQGAHPGGKVWTERHNGFLVEAGPNGFLDSKRSTLALCRALDLGDRLIPASAESAKNRYVFLGDRLRPLPGSFGAFLASDLLSWRGKLSLLLERFRRPKTKPNDESVAAFARRRAGREVADVFADALVTGIYAGDPALLSLRAAFPRLAQLEREHGSILGGMARSARQRRAAAAARGGRYQRPGTMWSLREGLGLLVQTLSDRLRRPPLQGVAVRSVRPAADGAGPSWRVTAGGHDAWEADAVVLTCPAYQQAAVLADLDAELADWLAGIAYNRVAVVALGFRRGDVPGALDGFGYIAPQRTRRDVLGVQWCSSIFPDRAPAGAVLLRAMCGGWHRAEVAGWPDGRLVHAVRADLRPAMGITADPVFQQIIRWDRAIPQYLLGHQDRVARIQERAGRYPGLFLGGNAYHGVALNDCTEQGERLAADVYRLLSARQGP